MAKVKKKTRKVVIKKKWVSILAPKMFNSQEIGETYVQDARQALGKDMTVNLMTLTRNPKTQGINVSFEITGQQDDHVITDFTGFKMMPSVVRRMVRRGRDKVDDSFVCSSQDGKKLRVKPLVVTRNKVRGSVLTGLRKSIRSYLTKLIAKTNYEKFAKEVVEKKFQREMKKSLSKVYPLSSCEIRWMHIVKEKKSPVSKKKKVEAKAEKPAEE